MKHLFFLLILGSQLLAHTAGAQAGLRVGGSWAGFVSDAELGHGKFSADTHLGYYAAIYYKIPLGKRLALVPEVQYSRERLTLYTTNGVVFEGSFATYDLSLAYVSLPLLVRATFGPVYLEVGGQAGWLVGGQQAGREALWGGGYYFVDVNQPVTVGYRRFDAGPCVGLGVQLPAGFGLSLRAYRGLVSLMPEEAYKRAEPSYLYYGPLHRQAVQAALTYHFGRRATHRARSTPRYSPS